MKKLAIGIMAGLLASCATTSEMAEDSSGGMDVRQAMIDGINPATLAVWDVTNEAMNDEGGLDAAQMDEARWVRMEEGARRLNAESLRLANAEKWVAGGPNLVDGKVPPGVATREEIQAAIDADPAGFRQISLTMAEMADGIANAAKARDAEVAGDLALNLDTACQACHVQYWYPNQQQ